MSGLLSEIRKHEEEAADVLEEAGYRSDRELESLTPEDLRKLFPESDQVKRRGKIYEIIKTQKPVDEVLSNIRGFIPEDVLKGDPKNKDVLLDYLCILKDQKDQMNNVQNFYDVHIKYLEEIIKDPPQTESEKVMSSLLSLIWLHDQNAASKLEEKGYGSDRELKILTKHDLEELFPRPDQLKLRERIFEIINTQKPVNEVLSKIKGFIPENFLKAALTEHGVLVDHLHILENQKDQMNNVQGFFDAHINFLKSSRDDAPQPESDKECPTKVTVLRESVRYKRLVCGKTFDTHQIILERLKDQVLLTESIDNHQITILFCVISSRVGSDVDAALTEVKDNKDIILVLMHHSREPTVTTPLRTWAHDGNDANVKLHVDVFYHETSGLLMCQQNYDAFSTIQNKLLAMYPGSKANVDTPPTKKEKRDGKSGKDDSDKSGGLGFLSLFSRKK